MDPPSDPPSVSEARSISVFSLVHDAIGAAEAALLGPSIHDRELAFYNFFVKVPSMLTVIVFIACLLAHGRELLDLRYTTAPKYAYLLPWKNSQCKSWLDIVLVLLYQLCWYATLSYYGTEFNAGGTLMLLSHGILHIGESHGINIKEMSILSCKWYAYTSILSILQAGAGMVGLYARVQAGKPHPSSKSQLPITELANVNYTAMPLLVSSLFLLAFNNSRTPGLTNMCLWKPESGKVNMWVYHHRDWLHFLALVATIVPMYIFSNIHKAVVPFILARARKLRGSVAQVPIQSIP